MNAAAGSIGDARAREREGAIREAFAAAGVEVEVRRCAGPRLCDTAREAATSGVDAVVAAGGDGTVSAVASALAGTTVPLAVLPLGTLNHFARDLGMPDDLGEAARAIAAGRVAPVDVGEVNGRIFVNNSSIGLYPLVVRTREAEQKATGHGKWRAMATAVWRVLRRFPLLSVCVRHDAGAVVTRTPFVFVGNNAYQLGPLAIGQRQRLDGGHLSLYVMRCRSRARMLWLSLRAILQGADAIEDLEAEDVDAAQITLRRARVQVAVDGEVVTMDTPLRYAIRAGALLVVHPPAADDAATVPEARPAGALAGVTSPAAATAAEATTGEAA